MSCGNNFKQIGLGLHNYHSAYDQLPKQRGGSFDSGLSDDFSNNNELSFLVGLLPFVEQQALWEQISTPSVTRVDGGTQSPPWPAMGPEPHTPNYVPWRTQIPGLRCPSDPTAGVGSYGKTNYVACLGDTVYHQEDSDINDSGIPAAGRDGRTFGRGSFQLHVVTKFADILDGLSNTIACGEIVVDSSKREVIGAFIDDNTAGLSRRMAPGRFADVVLEPSRPKFYLESLNLEGNMDYARGHRWMSGDSMIANFQTIRPPNSYSVSQGNYNDEGFATAASRHQGGCHILMGDGAVRFITESIDSGNQNHGPVGTEANGGGSSSGNEVTRGKESPFGVWGALGTRDASEVINGEF